MRRSGLAVAACAFALATLAGGASPPAAHAGIGETLCGGVGLISGLAGKACKVVTRVPGAIKKVAEGKPGAAIKKVLGIASKVPRGAGAAVGLTAVVAWVLGGAKFALHQTASVISATTSPQLTAAWASSVYWKVAALAALLTLPFLVAAAIQAILAADGMLLARAVFGYLPLAFLAVAIAAPVVSMLLALSDWMGASVAHAAGDQGAKFLSVTGGVVGGLSLLRGSPFLACLVGVVAAAGALVLWLELLLREAAVYVVVLMLPIAFAAMVWPARRVWAVRTVEILVALILAKFAIVSVLALAAAALAHGGGALIAKALAGVVLIVLGAFAPWALLRLLPIGELAASGAGHLRWHLRGAPMDAHAALNAVQSGQGWTGATLERMREQAGGTTHGSQPAPPAAGASVAGQLAGVGAQASSGGAGGAQPLSLSRGEATEATGSNGAISHGHSERSAASPAVSAGTLTAPPDGADADRPEPSPVRRTSPEVAGPEPPARAPRLLPDDDDSDGGL